VISAALLLDLWFAALPMVTSDSACPSTKSIESHLATLLDPQTAQPGTAIVKEQLDQLVIQLQPEGDDGAQRTIAVDGTCEDRAMAAAVAIATWWQVRPRRADPPVMAPEPVASVVAEPDREKDAAAMKVAGPAPSGATVTVGGFASLVSGESDAVAPGLRLGVDWLPGRGSLGLRVGVAVTGAHDGALAVGRVGWRRTAGELGLAWSRGPLAIDGAGIVSRLAVEGSGYTSNEASSGFSLGFGVGARLGWSLGRTGLWAEARGVGWPQAQRIVVENSATSARASRELPHAELQLGAGVSFRLF
jgi:hypothetical protein